MTSYAPTSSEKNYIALLLEQPYSYRRSGQDSYVRETLNYKLNDIPLSLNGHRFLIDHKLKHIVHAINQSKEILSLEEGWDGFDAKKIDFQTWVRAGHFLVDYSLAILSEFSTIIKAPSFNPAPNGSLDLSWRTPNGQFLINFKTNENKNIASYYGDLYNNEQPIKGVLQKEDLLRHLAFWMKNLA